MAGINLSQSIQERQAQAQVKFFDRGLMAALAILLLLAIAAGVLYWYNNSLTSQMTELDVTVAQKTATLKGKEVDHLVDFVDRLKHIEQHLQEEPDPTDLFRLIEENTLPTIRLTAFQFDREPVNKIRLTGEARTLKEIAQQMLVVKQLEGIKEVQADQITYDESGMIKFSLVLIRQTLSKAVPAS